MVTEQNNLSDSHLQEPAIETRQIRIEGMTCDNCVRKVESVLRGKAGVLEVNVDRAAARATVKFDRTRTDIPELHEALLRSGYRPTATPS